MVVHRTYRPLAVCYRWERISLKRMRLPECARLPIHVIVQVDQILKKHKMICRDPPMTARPDGQTGKQACPAMGCIG